MRKGVLRWEQPCQEPVTPAARSAEQRVGVPLAGRTGPGRPQQLDERALQPARALLVVIFLQVGDAQRLQLLERGLPRVPAAHAAH